jgi:ubiquinone/menaquinone biosynthesis C-methylase UbiE
MLLLRPARTDEEELMDRPGHDPAVLADNLTDLHLVNRWVGGAKLTLEALERLVPASAAGPLRILDVGAGGADIARVIAGWARRRSRSALVVAADLSHEILSIAARHRRSRGLRFAVGDALRLPFADGQFDVAVSSLMLHHLRPSAAVAALREMRRVARLGVVVNDIVRWWPGVWGAWLMARLFSGNPLTLHDGPLSVRRAYTRAELRDLAARAGLRGVELRGFVGYRVALTGV